MICWRRNLTTPFRTPEAILTAALSCLGGAGALATALDVCCGTGAAIWHLRPLCRERVVGIDFQSGHARRCPTLYRPGLPETPSSSWCAAMSCTCHFGPPSTWRSFRRTGAYPATGAAAVVAEVARALKPGGRFLFVTAPLPSRWSRPYWRHEVQCHAASAQCPAVPAVHHVLPDLPALGSRCSARQTRLFVHVHHGMFAGHFRHLRLVIGVLDQ